MLNSWGQIKAHRQLVICSFNFLSFLFFSLLNFSCSLSFHFLFLFLTLPYLTFPFPYLPFPFLLLLSFLADPSLTSFPSLPFPPPLPFLSFPSWSGLWWSVRCAVAGGDERWGPSSGAAPGPSVWMTSLPTSCAALIALIFHRGGGGTEFLLPLNYHTHMLTHMCTCLHTQTQ